MPELTKPTIIMSRAHLAVQVRVTQWNRIWVNQVLFIRTGQGTLQTILARIRLSLVCLLSWVLEQVCYLMICDVKGGRNCGNLRNNVCSFSVDVRYYLLSCVFRDAHCAWGLSCCASRSLYYSLCTCSVVSSVVGLCLTSVSVFVHCNAYLYVWSLSSQ